MTEKNIIVALDDPFDYQGVLEVLDPKKCIIKVGSVIFNYHGRKILDEVSNHGFEIFFDIKFHDIPNTCLLYTSPSPRDVEESRMPSSA